VGFGGECGNRVALWSGLNRRSEQLACMECDLAAHTTALGTADAAKWVNRQEYCCQVDATARNDQHGYIDRSMSETGRGSSRAVSGAHWKVRRRVPHPAEGGVVLKVQTRPD
jgi:hypothetical protein